MQKKNTHTLHVSTTHQVKEIPMIAGILLFVAATMIVVMIHEVGHALMAATVNVPPQKVQFGIPTVFKFHWKTVPIHIGLIPIIGWVRMPDNFLTFSWWKRALIALAGPALGILSSVAFMVLALVLASAFGIHSPTDLPTANACDTNALRSNSDVFLQAVNTAGLWGFLFWTGVLGLIINIFNLLPIPGLDGGRFLGALVQLTPISRIKYMNSVTEIITVLCILALVGWTVWSLISNAVGIVTTTPLPC
jgi:membrane-associated protease RseP (regulator of RpoE activity)